MRRLALLIALVAAAVALPAAGAGAQVGSCPAAPTFSFSSSGPITVPIGAGSATAPWVTVACNWAPYPDPTVAVTLQPHAGSGRRLAVIAPAGHGSVGKRQRAGARRTPYAVRA
jgi:hypothetical protein